MAIEDLTLERAPGVYNVVVETPRGSQVKLKYNAGNGLFEWSRGLRFGLVFPYDYGFLPQTTAGDGDAVDAMVITEVSSYPGVVVPARVVGALRVTQNRDGTPKRNDRVMVVPVNEHRLAHVTEVSELPPRVLAEIEEFFASSLVLTGKTVTFGGWADAAEAIGSLGIA